MGKRHAVTKVNTAIKWPMEAIMKSIDDSFSLLDDTQKEIVVQEAVKQKLVNSAVRVLDIASFNWDSEVSRFLDSSRYRSEHTRLTYERALDRFKKWADNNNILPLSIRYAQADDFITYLKGSDNSRGATNSTSTVRVMIAGVSAFFSYMERRSERQVVNPFKGTRELPMRSNKHTKAVPTKSEVDTILQYLVDNGHILDAAMVAVCSYNGLRLGALPTLTLNSKGLYNGYSKGKDVKGLKLDKRAIRAIEAAGLNKAAPFREVNIDNAKMRLNYMLKKLHKTGQIGNVYSYHTFRHYFAITYYTKNKDIYTLKKLLNHSSIAVTEVYLQSLGILEKQ